VRRLEVCDDRTSRNAGHLIFPKRKTLRKGGQEEIAARLKNLEALIFPGVSPGRS
jgi:hypothetical protein